MGTSATRVRRSRWSVLVGVTVGLVLALEVAAPTAAFSDDYVLVVGNSFTGGLRKNLRQLTKSALRDTSWSISARRGATLNDHAVSRRTARRLEGRPWDAVVLQEQSDGLNEERYPGARELDAQISAIGARTIFFMTWADRDDDFEMYDELRGEPGGDVGYIPIALELGAPVAPVGWAFREVLLEEPDADLWKRDGHHASHRGRYLASLVLYAVIYDESPVGLWITPRITPEVGLHDQLLVERVVFDNPSEWNLPAP